MENIFINPKNNTNAQTRVRGRQANAGVQMSGKKKKKSQTVRPALPRYFGSGFSPVSTRTLNIFTTAVTTAGGVISIQPRSASAVTAAPSWGNISQEFESYRVREVRVRFVPSTTNATSTTGPYQSMIMVGRWAQLSPTTQGNLEQKGDTVYHSTLEEFEYDANFLGIKELQDWIPVGTGLATAQNYGIAYMTPAGVSALAASSDIFSVRTQFVVEFKKAN